MWNFLKTLVLGFRPVQTTGHRAQSSLSGEARSLSDEIDKLRINANRLAAEFKRCYQEEPERQVELRRLASEAQSEADEMRRFFRCSQEAYNDGDGAAAKALSIEGKEHQCRAESLNSRAREIRDIGKLGKHKELECRELNSKIALRSKDKERLDYALDLLKSRSEAWTTTIDRRLGTLPGRVLDVFTKMEQDDPDGLGLFLRGLANPALDEEMACQLPLALADLLGAHPVAAGMFPRLEHRGPGARAWATNLANPDGASAAGTAYELLATRRLMRVSAGELRILPTDELAFGPKQQARYKPDEMKTKDLLAALVRAAPRRWASVAASTSAIERKTVEADVLLHRAGAEISVDFKYTAAGTRSLERAQLLGVGVALATGEISNAHFVCNGCFDRTTQQRVDDVNRLMLEWNTGQVSLHSEYAWRV